jgi:hypothetical protein
VLHSFFQKFSSVYDFEGNPNMVFRFFGFLILTKIFSLAIQYIVQKQIIYIENRILEY